MSANFHQKQPQIEHFNDGFGLHFSILRFLGNKKSPMPRTLEKQVAQSAKRALYTAAEMNDAPRMEVLLSIFCIAQQCSSRKRIQS